MLTDILKPKYNKFSYIPGFDTYSEKSDDYREGDKIF